MRKKKRKKNRKKKKRRKKKKKKKKKKNCLPTATMATLTCLNAMLHVHWLSCCQYRR